MLPICGAAIFFPLKSDAEFISELGCTIKLAPPLAAPDKIWIFLFSEFKNPLIAGPGPTYATSTEFAKRDSIT